MPTIKELVDDIHADKNAVSAAQKGMDAVRSFVADTRGKLEAGAIDEAKTAFANLAYLVEELDRAIPANVIPASAGPVGASPHEQYLEQAAGIVQESLAKMSEVVSKVHGSLQGLDEALGHLNRASAAIKSPDLKKAAA